MLGQELLETLGATPLLLAILIPFWVGDEALSPEFRGDVARWLRHVAHIGAAVGTRRSDGAEVAGIVLGLFERFFGRELPRFNSLYAQRLSAWAC